MKKAEVLAVVVSYNGSDTIAATVLALRDQVGRVLIVDNGSSAETQDLLSQLERKAGVEVFRLGENTGIGHALNRGVARARSLGFSWLLTMDQDSLANDSMLAAYERALEVNPGAVCLTPRLEGGGSASDGECVAVRYAITSGNLIQLALFERIGEYDEGFFIDCVDFEFSLRVRKAGHQILLVPGAVLRHRLGEPTSPPGFAKKYYALHSPLRRYYMYRNFMYLAERYVFRFPGFILKLGMLQVVLLVLMGFFDRHPMRSYQAVCRGIFDYFRRRQGKISRESRAR